MKVCNLIWSIAILASAILSWVTVWAETGFPNATLALVLLHIFSNATSVSPINLIQWCILPGPNLPCAISNPLPSPNSKFSFGTLTFVKDTSACPCGASVKPKTGKYLSTFIPGVSIGTTIWDCCLCLSELLGSVLPIKINTLHLGSIAPEVHHFFPLIM